MPRSRRDLADPDFLANAIEHFTCASEELAKIDPKLLKVADRPVLTAARKAAKDGCTSTTKALQKIKIA